MRKKSTTANAELRSKGIAAWVREILGKRPEISEMPEIPDESVVTSLIARAAGDGEEMRDAPDGNADEKGVDNATENKEDAGGEDGGRKCSCPYAVKRNIVASLHEIRSFAEEHNLAATVVRALLTILADMAVNALKGKVSGSVLESLLKIFNFEREKEEAYRRGELDGRNARIIEEYFPTPPEDIPHLGGGIRRETDSPNIFTMARNA